MGPSQLPEGPEIAVSKAPVTLKEIQIKKKAPINPETASPMVIDLPPSPLLESTRKRQLSIEVLTPPDKKQKKSKAPRPPQTEEEKILVKKLIREHVDLWKACKTAVQKNNLRDLRKILDWAQKSQKDLQKYLENQEIQDYVEDWNPWEERRKHFPPRASSSSVRHQSRRDYSDSNKWKEVAHLIQSARGIYDSLP